ncbi:MAG: transposase [Candidatus Competibacteraceae bacterium]
MQRKRFTAEFKAEVALEALWSERTLNELAGAYDVHPNQVSNWKREAQAGLVEIFSTKRGRQAAHDLAERERLYNQIGRLQVELDGLKKSPG